MTVFIGTGSDETIIPGTLSPSVLSDGSGSPDNSADVIIAGAGLDSIDGGGGNDTLLGGAGIDTLHGGAGNDLIIWTPGDGNDVIDGDADTDTLRLGGTNGADTFTLTVNSSHVAVTGLATDSFTLDVATVENIIVSAGSGNDNDTLTAGNGLTAALGALTLDGGAGNDSISLAFPGIDRERVVGVRVDGDVSGR